MTSRRRFLQYGLTATAWPLASSAASAAGIGFSARLPLYAVVYDTRFAASRAFAQAAGKLGLATRSFAGDMTGLWYTDIHRRWQQGAVAIAGLTTRGACFCFDQLGREHRLSVLFEAEHRPLIDGTTAHSLTGPLPMLDRARALTVPGASLGPTMAAVIAHSPAVSAAAGSVRLASPATPATALPAHGLVSWVIAPAHWA